MSEMNWRESLFYDQKNGYDLIDAEETKLVFASVDRSPHCTQMHYIPHEIERTMKQHIPMEHYVVSEGKVVRVTESAIELSKSLAKLSTGMYGDSKQGGEPTRFS